MLIVLGEKIRDAKASLKIKSIVSLWLRTKTSSACDFGTTRSKLVPVVGSKFLQQVTSRSQGVAWKRSSSSEVNRGVGDMYVLTAIVNNAGDSVTLQV